MAFFHLVRDWFDRYFGDSETIFLFCILVFLAVLILALGGVLAPVIAGLVGAFAVNGVVDRLVKFRVPRLLAIAVVMLIFTGALVALIVVILPVVWTQLQQVVAGIPTFVENVGELFKRLSAEYPDLLPDAVNEEIVVYSQGRLTEWGGLLIQSTISQLPNVVGLLIFVVLAPLSMFFFLKDHRTLLNWFMSLLPAKRQKLDHVGKEMIEKTAQYIRGKVLEILIVGFVTYLVFAALGLDYALLLGLIVGLSVLIPFIGAALVTIPVLIVAILQFGWGWEFFYVVLAYSIIQVLDGNVLVPVLFSEVLDLHPITIIVAVLAFGGLWGIWGVFFAIPLATLVKAIYNAWPGTAIPQDEVSS